MSIFDFLFSNEKKRKKQQTYQSTPNGGDRNTVAPTIESPQIKLDSHRFDHLRTRFDKQQRGPLKLTDTRRIISALKVDVPKENIKHIEIGFPVRRATIYCHSLLIDKLGDLTKFIIQSIFRGYTESEILEITGIGQYTIEEEYEYLIKGGLINSERKLTELGTQYAQLINYIDEIRDGIPVFLNTYTDRFIVSDEELYEIDGLGSTYYMPEHYSAILTRNDNYSNSLDIAKRCIEETIPFSREIKNSLYTTVNVERDQFNRVEKRSIDFRNGHYYKDTTSVGVVIPYEEVTFLPRYRDIDKYRNMNDTIENISDEEKALLPEERKEVLEKLEEEQNCKPIVVYINTITGEINSYWKMNDEEKPVLEAVRTETMPCTISIDKEKCDNIYMHIVCQKRLFRTIYYDYKNMGVINNEARSSV